MRLIVCLLFVFSSILHAEDQTLFTNDFEEGILDDHLEQSANGCALTPNSDADGRHLEIGEAVKSVKLKPMPTIPGTKHKLSFRAKMNGVNGVEDNDRAHIDMLRSYGRFLPSYQITFFDESGGEVKPHGYQRGGGIVTTTWHDYVHVFHAPPKAKKALIRFWPRGRKLSIDDVTLEETTEDGTVNCNPDFRYGELNYCGWRPARGGRLYARPDGKTVLNTGYAATSGPFPLRPEDTYRFFARGEKTTEKGWLSLTFFGEKGKRLGSRFLLRPTPEGESVDLIPPAGTTYGAVALYSVILEELKVTKLDDEHPKERMENKQ